MTHKSIEAAVFEAMAPSHGGLLVEQIVTVSGKVYRASEGWLLELCPGENCLHIRRIGSTVYRRVELDLLQYAGDYSTTLDELSAAERSDWQREETRRIDEEITVVFDRITTEPPPPSDDEPEIEYTPADVA